MHIMDYRISNTTFERNQKANSKVANRSDCMICGKATNTETCKTWVEVTTDGELIEIGVDHPRSQGCFTVGSDCAKKIPSRYVRTN